MPVPVRNVEVWDIWVHYDRKKIQSAKNYDADAAAAILRTKTRPKRHKLKRVM